MKLMKILTRNFIKFLFEIIINSLIFSIGIISIIFIIPITIGYIIVNWLNINFIHYFVYLNLCSPTLSDLELWALHGHLIFYPCLLFGILIIILIS